MSKKIKKIMEDINALEVDDAIKKVFTKSLDELNEENKTEITRMKTKLSDGFAEEKTGLLGELDKLKNVEPANPNEALLDRLKVMETKLKTEQTLREETEERQLDSTIESKLKSTFSDSIDAELLAERYKKKVKLVDGNLYSNDSDMIPISEMKENIKTEKPHLWKAAGVGGSGTTGKNAVGGVGDISVDGMDLATFRANKEAILKNAANQ